MSVLVRAFEQAASMTGASAQTTYDTAELAELLRQLHVRGRGAHRRLRLAEEPFARCLARCADETPFRSLEKLAIEDLYLACACLERVRGAADAFEAAHRKVIRRAVARVTPANRDRDEAEQRVRQHLLVGERDAGPAIAKYRGNVPLAKWISVVAIRVAISLKRTESAEQRLRQKAGAEAMGVSPEHLYMQAELRRVIEPAVAEALGRLADRDRLIMRLYFVGRMSSHEIAPVVDLSHQAVSKRLVKAREAILKDIRETVCTKLKIPKDELSSAMRFVVSQLDLNVSRALREK
jgi:RNA polymerase sigma-70 factor, ECF subfamily